MSPKTYDAGWATITLFPEPDEQKVTEGLLMILNWRIERLRKEGKLPQWADSIASPPPKTAPSS